MGGDGGVGRPGGDPPTIPPGFTLPDHTPTPVIVAVRWALAQVGTPYVFGGDCTSPHSGEAARQCDCSSLMQKAYGAAGFQLPRTTRDQVHAGTAVSDATAIRPGDLIFIPGSEGTVVRPRHVGMAIGSGLIVQAPETGDVVKTSELSAWTDRIAAIRRIVPQ
ncbi:C40 family peptidase [Salinispora arenicola]|uniref:C40 family peptidase n=1 Tax=Salinispora arenicola TaxID=168697 RepID=UPI0036F22328